MVTTISPDRLAELLDEDRAEQRSADSRAAPPPDADFALVDTRPEDSYESWRVAGALHFPFGPEEELDDRLDDLRELVGDVDRVVTICAKGISSGNLATRLASATDEYEVNAVDGGMKGWSGVYDRVDVGDDLDIGDDLVLVQLQRRAKGCLSYLVGCGETGDAIVVDATADVDEVMATAAERGLSIVGVVDTHVHADHVSGGRDLADQLGVPYYLSDRAEERGVEFEFTQLSRNQVLDVGNLAVKAIAAPGHTSEMMNLLVDDAALLTADTLHVGSTGRTELEFGEDEGEAPRASEDPSSAERSSANSRAAEPRDNGETAREGDEGARMLYETLHRTILAEPESMVVLPGHVAVTNDGRFEHGSPGEPIATTIGEARTGIDALDLDEEAFVDRLADAGEKPSNYEEIIDRNRGAIDLPPEDRVELELGPNNCSA